MIISVRHCHIGFILFVGFFNSTATAATRLALGPYGRQVAEKTAALTDASADVRASAVESLGFLRAYDAEETLIARLQDESRQVRRAAALALAWCGGRAAVPPLFDALGDRDWLTRQAAHVALTNLTGMEFPFDAAAPARNRQVAIMVWRNWWASLRPGETPTSVSELLENGPKPWLRRHRANASSTYKGPVDVLFDGAIGPRFWQTKNVPFPQFLTIDLGKSQAIDQVVVHQYGPRFVMTDYSLAVSDDGAHFETVLRRKERSPVKLELDAGGHVARYVRITSHAALNATYPTTFLEVEISGANRATRDLSDETIWRYERGFRALGTLGGPEATATILRLLGAAPPADPSLRPMVSVAVRSLGRLHSEAGFQYLLQLLDDPMWARRAAEALGDYGDTRAVPHLLRAYPRYAKRLDGTDPPDVPLDDKMSFPSEDRMLETPYCILFALSRLTLDDPQSIETLRNLAPLLLANVPDDHDAFFLYEQEPGQRFTRYLLVKCGLRREALEHAFQLLEPSGAGEAVRPVPTPVKMTTPVNVPTQRIWPTFAPYRVASWLPILCTDKQDVERLLELLQHEEGWVRLNAAKTLGWLGDPRAIEPLARLLETTPPEAAFGYSGTFKDEEYADPAPRWREALIRALGLLDADNQTELLIGILRDERSVLEIRRAAADALAELGNERALVALRRAATQHDFFSIRHVARDALRAAGVAWDANVPPIKTALDKTALDKTALNKTALNKTAPVNSAPVNSAPVNTAPFKTKLGLAPLVGRSSCEDSVPVPHGVSDGMPKAIVFLKGSNSIPNTLGTVEQADRWRQTYVVTDSGPAYRPARNLYLLSPPEPDGKVTPVTAFVDGYVAEPELSWDARHVVFCRRGEADPWWQIWRVNLDGSQLRQLTRGPYHHVGPVYLPDGRIACASSRLGIRDEYHGYPCTGLVVMNPDGSDMHPIATNIGRDNEPAVLPDGRLVFSRLEVFYSRNKTELTLHATHVDGTQDIVLYGPERRQFWRDLNHGPLTPADGQEAPLTHRVLRMTQPQPMPDGRNVIVVTQGGLVLVGPRRDRETFVSPDNKNRAYTTPFPLPDGRVLCASTLKTPDREQVDLGIYVLDPRTKMLKLVYNDPRTADFEARPVLARRPPRTMPIATHEGAFAGRFLCSSVFDTREPGVRSRGRLVRLVEGVPMVARHSTQTNPWEVWKNHGGTLARVLGTVPLASDGSFYVEAPADRLLHFQVLDSDRRVVGNQLTWIYTRPGETKSCVGCHEPTQSAARLNSSLASHYEPIRLMPHAGEFRYRAKAWFKGYLPADIEERTRTVRAVNLLGRW